MSRYGAGEAASTIARSIGCSRRTINRLVNKNGGHRSLAEQLSSYTINRRYFQHITTEDSAYWFGFLLADGHIKLRQRAVSRHIDRRLTLRLARIDRSHLEKFRTSIGSNHPIKHEHKTKSCRLTINCTSMVRDLIEHGVNSFKIDGSWPYVSESIVRHTIRGLIDGDGWISRRRTKFIPHVGYCCPHLEPVVRTAQLMGITNQPRYHKGVWRWDKVGRRSGRSIYHYLYDDSTVWLDRKRDLFGMLL